jgi:hypothetical protein
VEYEKRAEMKSFVVRAGSCAAVGSRRTRAQTGGPPLKEEASGEALHAHLVSAESRRTKL